MSTIDRRTLLKGAAATAIAAGPFQGLLARAAFAEGGPTHWGGRHGGPGDYGPLVDVPDLRDGQVRLRVPEGFSYMSFGLTGEPMADGIPTPGRSDGMAAFRGPRGTIRLVRNHEILFDPGAIDPSRPLYDAKSGGGTTTIEVDLKRHQVTTWLSAQGTNTNCAGGPTPWGSWITCEETVNGPDANIAFTGATLDLDEKHGYIFEVPSSRGPNELVAPEPIRAAGRFTHEAVAVDPATGILYMTQDDFASASGFFRYIAPEDPRKVKRYLDGGVLEVLGVIPDGATDPVALDLTTGQTIGTTYRAAWIRIEDPDPDIPVGTDNDTAAATLMRDQGIPSGAAIFSRIEGCWESRRKIFFASTQGGDAPDGPTRGFGTGRGQIWMYDAVRETLTLVFESPGADVLDMPDNLTISPRGGLVMCEDGDSPQFVRGLTPHGQVFDLIENVIPGQEGDEFAGATFDPSSKVLFFNVQARSSTTFAMWGPWGKGPL